MYFLHWLSHLPIVESRRTPLQQLGRTQKSLDIIADGLLSVLQFSLLAWKLVICLIWSGDKEFFQIVPGYPPKETKNQKTFSPDPAWNSWRLQQKWPVPALWHCHKVHNQLPQDYAQAVKHLSQKVHQGTPGIWRSIVRFLHFYSYDTTGVSGMGMVFYSIPMHEVAQMCPWWTTEIPTGCTNTNYVEESNTLI